MYNTITFHQLLHLKRPTDITVPENTDFRTTEYTEGILAA